jgi:ElaB/YqjD/DUF883 family membrane-anchored ribosome-binding protein
MKSNEKLVKDVKVLMADLEAILDEVKDKTSNEISEIHASLTKKIETTKEQLIKSEQDWLEKEQVGAKLANEYVQNNAWKLAMIAAVLGFLIGYTI